MIGLESSRSGLGGTRRRLHKARRGGGEGHLGRRLLVAALVVVLLVAAFVAFQLLRGVPAPRLASSLPGRTKLPGSSAGLPFPPGAETTVAVSGIGTVASTGGDTPVPIASVTKLMSCLVILADHPLKPGSQGPVITITPADVAEYRRELAAQDSVVPVVAGEHLTEHQALEAALVPSADNVIRLLARWDAGSKAAFVTRMNLKARQLGLSATHYAGPSGVNPATESSAADQARVAQLAMANPVIAQIVAMPQVVLPVAGLQYNVNGDLGHDGIVGVKTGWVPAGGASFVFAARRSVAGQRRLVLGAIVGVRQAPPLPTVLSYGRRLAVALGSRLEEVTAFRAGQQIGTVVSGSGATVPVLLSGPVRLLAWPGAVVHESLRSAAHLTTPLSAHERVGTLLVQLGTERRAVPLEVAGPLASPSLAWRLGRL